MDIDTTNRSRKNCAVPQCLSTTQRNPNMIFFSSPPNGSVLRETWMTAMRRKNRLGPKTKFYVCQEHFDLDNDIEQCVNNVPKLKANVVPHRFYCQYDKQEPNKRLCSIKREIKKKEVEQKSKEQTKEEEDVYDYDDIENVHCEVQLLFDVGVQCEISNDELDLVEQTSEEINKSESSDNDWEYDTIESESDHSYSDDEQLNIRGIIPHYYFSSLREYTGLPNNCINLLHIISDVMKISVRDIFIVLVKVRKNYTFTDIANQFQLSEKSVITIFNKILPLLCAAIEKFIVWPTRNQILDELPIAYRMNFEHVQCIIDCLEIEIQQPSHSSNQTGSWSRYKTCNTLKYLIASTPNGLVTFVSNGFGGRVSDIEIVKQSNFVEHLPREMTIMADRGFKGIATLLEAKGHHLLRPPSVSSGQKLSKEDVKLTKQIASLRIHIERVIRRLREFSMLDKHCALHYKHQRYLDDIITLSAAIINLQPLLIK